MIATVTDEAATSIPAAGRRWNTTTPSAWSKKKPYKKKQLRYSSGNVTASAPADSYARAAATAVSVYAKAAVAAAWV
jgi:hypothetical protein